MEREEGGGGEEAVGGGGGGGGGGEGEREGRERERENILLFQESPGEIPGSIPWDHMPNPVFQNPANAVLEQLWGSISCHQEA